MRKVICAQENRHDVITMAELENPFSTYEMDDLLEMFFSCAGASKEIEVPENYKQG